MRWFTVLIGIAALVLGLGKIARAETDAQTMQAMQAIAAEREAKEREAQFSDPLKPDLAKDRAFLGSRKAPIVVVEYSDFQCPYCRQGFQAVEEIRKKYGDKIAFMFKHFPLTAIHPFAMPAAQHFEAIALQSSKKAYQFHDEVFTNQDRISEGDAFFDEIAKKLKVNVAKMKKDMESEKVKTRIAADTAEAQKFGMAGTPGFIVAGVEFKGAYPSSELEKVIDRKLSERKISSKK